MTVKLQDKLAYAPRGLRAERAAAYIGMGKTKFLEGVDTGELPQPVIIHGIKVWDRLDLDAAFEVAKTEDDERAPNSFDKILSAK